MGKVKEIGLTLLFILTIAVIINTFVTQRPSVTGFIRLDLIAVALILVAPGAAILLHFTD